jgi:hypothetical protein
MKASWAGAMLWIVICGCTSEKATNTPPPAPNPNLMPMAGPASPVLPDALSPPPVAAQPQPAQPVQPPPVVGGTPGTTPPVVASPPPVPDTERVKAEKGAGLAGRSLDPYEGALVTPAKVYFTVRERVVFEDQIPKALQLYKATNDKAPQSFEELKAQVLDPNQIRLPDLPPGQRYVWDPKAEELQVERPRR